MPDGDENESNESKIELMTASLAGLTLTRAGERFLERDFSLLVERVRDDELSAWSHCCRPFRAESVAAISAGRPSGPKVEALALVSTKI